MSRARHKLTGIRHSIHDSKTYQDETGTNGTDIIIGSTGASGWRGGWSDTIDGDSYIWTAWSDLPGVADGTLTEWEISEWHDSITMKVGTSQSWNNWRRSRLLYNIDLFYNPDSEINSNSEIKQATLKVRVAGGIGVENADYDNMMNSNTCTIYRNRQTLMDDIDVSYSWWDQWGPTADGSNDWGLTGADDTTSDIDTSITASVVLQPMDSSTYDNVYIPWSIGDAVEIDVTELVQDAVTNRGGLLKTIWIKSNDEGEDFYNETYFYSGNAYGNDDWKPTLTIQWHNP